MTLDEFFDELKALDIEWKLNSIGAIRCENGLCPIAALANSKGHYVTNESALTQGFQLLNMQYDIASEIVGAADDFHPSFLSQTKEIRARLLEELGL